MKVLMIEDNVDDIAGIIDFCAEQGWEQENKSFDEGLEYIEECNPDIIVLDLQDKADDCFSGSSILDAIWNKSFRPVCVFSGQIVNASVDEGKYPSPLIRFINKGDENPVKEYLSQIAPYTQIIKEMQNKMHSAFRDSFGVLEYVIKDNILDENIIGYLCNNRIREFFSNEDEEIKLPPWGQYIYPVLSKSFVTGDIVCKKAEYDPNSTKCFYAVLSQSCDLAYKKVNGVLLAECDSIEVIKQKYPGENFTQKELISLLNEGFSRKYYPLPELKGVIPDLVVNLKKIIVVETKEFFKEYKAIVSLSSPYRERLVWAYMQNACRPGVPTLDAEKWAKKILQDEEDEEK